MGLEAINQAGTSAPPRDLDPCRATDLSMGTEKWIDVDGIRTRYFDQGSGPAMVFLHGGMYGGIDCSSSALWDVIFAPLAKGFNVIAVDRLGQGYTDNPKSDGDFTFDASVQHAAAFLRRLAKGPYHVVGHALGGFVAARLALEDPALVRSATCIAPGSLSPGVERGPFVLSDLPAWSARATIRACYERNCFDPRVVTERMLDEAEAVSRTLGHRLAAERMLAGGLESKLFRPELGRRRFESQRWLLERGMPCPTLVAWGLQDPIADVEDGLILFEMFMKCQRETELRLFNRAGHYVHREHPESFARLLWGFAASYS